MLTVPPLAGEGFNPTAPQGGSSAHLRLPGKPSRVLNFTAHPVNGNVWKC